MIKEFHEEFKNIPLDKWVDFINKYAGIHGKPFLRDRYDETKLELYKKCEFVQRRDVYKIVFSETGGYGKINIAYCCMMKPYYHYIEPEFLYNITITPFHVSSPFENNDKFFAAIKQFINQHCPHYQEAIKEEIELRTNQIKDDLSL